MTRRFGFLAKLSIVPCLALTAWTTSWSIDVASHFRLFAIERDLSLSALRLGAVARDDLMMRFERLLASASRTETAPRLPTITLEANDSDLRSLDTHLPDSGRHWIDARLRCDEPAWDFEGGNVELRYRGDTYIHWGGPKKSFRIKTPKTHLLNRMRTFNLVVPKSGDALCNHMSAWLARRMGLLAPKTAHVRVVLNGEDFGIYILTEQPDETLLRSQRRTPGPIYSGETWFQDQWSGVVQTLFAHSGLWSQVEKRNTEPAARRKPLDALLECLAAPRDESRTRSLIDLIDVEAFARLAFLEELTQSTHLDAHHNWRLAWNEATRRFEPVVWDLVGWHEQWRPSAARRRGRFVHAAWTPLHDALLSSIAFHHSRAKVARSFFEQGLDREFLDELNRLARVLDRESRSDRSRVDLTHGRATSARESWSAFATESMRAARQTWIDGPREALTRSVHACSMAYAASPDRGIRLLVDSDVAFDGIAIRYAGLLRVDSVHLMLTRDGVSTEYDLGEQWSCDGERVQIDFPFVSSMERRFGFDGVDPVRNREVAKRPTTYSLRIDGVGTRQIIDVVALQGNEHVPIAAIATIPERDFGDLWLGFSPRSRPERAPRWTGTRTIAGHVVMKDRIEIVAGTKLVFAEGASLTFEQGVGAHGTEDAPIRFEGPGSGVVVVRGSPDADFEHCTFEGLGGSTDALGPRHASLCLFGTNANVAHCVFAAPKAVEDVIHVAHANVEFDEVRIAGGIDGIDCDVARVRFHDVHVRECDGDGIDLMDSHAFVSKCLIERCTDKAVSVGERSRALVSESTLTNCLIGIEVKDGSLARLQHTDISKCRIGVRASEKNWRYENGGNAECLRSVLEDCDTLVECLGRSTIRVVNCRVPPDTAERSPTLIGVEWTDSDSSTTARGKQREAWSIPMAELQGLVRKNEAVVHEQRGPRGR
ncbi:MAG: CotH kinase family protein [Planctomycetes bacterium]|nr:CotH kinase family protein [Planctomycetota bacterium]